MTSTLFEAVLLAHDNFAALFYYGQVLYSDLCGWQLKTAITVGVIGLPNVGKSSLINSMKRTRAVSVGSTPGITKVLQEVQLDKHVKLLDCPGVVMAKASENEQAAVLRNSTRIENLEDPLGPGNYFWCVEFLLAA